MEQQQHSAVSALPAGGHVTVRPTTAGVAGGRRPAVQQISPFDTDTSDAGVRPGQQHQPARPAASTTSAEASSLALAPGARGSCREAGAAWPNPCWYYSWHVAASRPPLAFPWHLSR
jgi:hypothetical protein